MMGEHIKAAKFVRAARGLGALSVLPALLFLSTLSACTGSGVVSNPSSSALASGTGSELLRFDAGTNIPNHILTWDQLGGTNGTHRISWSEAAQHLTWAMTSPLDSVAIKAVGIKTAFYTDPNRQAPGDPLYTGDESTFAHDCAGHRLYSTAHHDQALMQVPTTDLWLLWGAWIQLITTRYGGIFDAIYDDQADEVQYASGVPCNFDWNAWTDASNAMNRSLGLPIVYNSLGQFSGYGKTLGVSPTIALNATSIGGEAEGCYSESPKNRPHTYEWVAYENTEIQMYGSGRLFLCTGSNHAAAKSSRDERIYQYASFLLTYNRAWSVLVEKFDTPSGFHVEPESELVATKPLVPEPTDISALLLTTGVYGREYGACYVKGAYVGPCAAVVNSDDKRVYHAFPWPGKYNHTLVLNGGGIVDGGTIATNGPAPSKKIRGEQAVIAFP